MLAIPPLRAWGPVLLWNGQAWSGGESSGTRYKIKQNPGASFSITCSPDVQFSGTGSLGPPPAEGRGGSEIRYQADAQSLEVVLSGGIGDKDDKQYLIGQKATATAVTAGLDPESFDWSVSGGAPFKSYTPGQTTATFKELDFSAEKGNQLTFHFKEPVAEPGRATVTYTVRLKTPLGALPATLDVTVSTKVGVKAPTFTFDAARGTVGFDNPSAPTKFLFQGATLYGVNGGCVWTGTVTTPSGFVGGAGGWNFTQTVTPNRVIQSPQATHNFSYNGQRGLDAQFSYAPGPGQPDYPADGTRHTDGDSPDQFVRPPFTNVKASDTFDLYVLYQPPGQDSTYVPLTQYSWSWKGEAAPNTFGGWDLLDAGSASFPRTGWPLHPKWAHNNRIGWTWDPPLPPRP